MSVHRPRSTLICPQFLPVIAAVRWRNICSAAPAGPRPNHAGARRALHRDRKSGEHMPGESLRIKGEIIAKEDLHFQGQIEGTITVPEHTLTVGPQARLEADVKARAVVVAGMLS